LPALTAATPSGSPIVPLVDTLLRAGDLPNYLQPEGIDDPTPFEIDQAAFEANGGSRAISQMWQSQAGPVLAVVDFRMALPTAEDAAAYLDAAEPILSEASDTGLMPVADGPIGEDARHYSGTVDSLGDTLILDVFLFRVGATAAKLFVAGLDGAGDEASPIARAALARLGGEPAATADATSPTETGVPRATRSPDASDTAVATLLAHLPAFIAPTCRSDDSPFGIGIALTCTTIDPVAVSYTLLDDMVELDAVFAQAQAEMGVTPIAASCEDGPFVGRYDIAGLGTGRILCTTTGTEQVYLWNRDDLPILAFAVSDTYDFPQFHAWWLGAGPNP
jgi:hypothetical protein